MNSEKKRAKEKVKEEPPTDDVKPRETSKNRRRLHKNEIVPVELHSEIKNPSTKVVLASKITTA